MRKRSAGILLFRGRGAELRLLLVHPGGPFWAKKDLGAWSIPKGEHEEGDIPLAVARREFEEELGEPAPAGDAIELGELVQPSRKVITAYAIEGDFDPSRLKSNSMRRARRSCLASDPSSTGWSITLAGSLLRGLQRLALSTAFWGCAGGAIRARFQR